MLNIYDVFDSWLSSSDNKCKALLRHFEILKILLKRNFILIFLLELKNFIKQYFSELWIQTDH